MKKIVALLSTVVLLLVLCCTPAMAISAKRVKVGATLYVSTSNGGSLNARESGSSTAKIIYRIPNNSELTVLEAPSNGFVQVEFKYNGRFANGYVNLTYVTKTVPEKINTSGATKVDEGSGSGKTAETVASLSFRSYKLIDSANRLLVVAAKPTRAGGFVNLRWVPSMESQIISKLYAGEEVTVIAEGSYWYQAKNADGYIGYIYKKYTEVIYDGDPAGYAVGAEEDTSSAAN